MIWEAAFTQFRVSFFPHQHFPLSSIYLIPPPYYLFLSSDTCFPPSLSLSVDVCESIYMCTLITQLITTTFSSQRTSNYTTTKSMSVFVFGFCFVSSLIITLFLASSATACDRCVRESKVAFFSKAQALQCKNIQYFTILFSFSYFSIFW